MKLLDGLNGFNEREIMYQFVIRAGRIRKLYVSYYDKWIIWYAPKVAPRPVEIFNITFTRRFRGNNKGRHWNRKDCHGKT